MGLHRWKGKRCSALTRLCTTDELSALLPACENSRLRSSVRLADSRKCRLDYGGTKQRYRRGGRNSPTHDDHIDDLVGLIYYCYLGEVGIEIEIIRHLWETYAS